MRFIQVFFLAAMSIVFGETTGQGVFTGGLKAGVNISTLNATDGVSNYSFKPGYQGGAYLRYSLDNLFLQIDGLYSVQGSSIEYGEEKYSATFRYANIPIAVAYRLGRSFNVQAGPQVGFLMCAKSDYHPVTHEPFAEQTYTKAYKKSDAGVFAGIGYAPLSDRVTIDVRFYLGLAAIDDFAGVAETKNRSIQLSFAYLIYRKK